MLQVSCDTRCCDVSPRLGKTKQINTHHLSYMFNRAKNKVYKSDQLINNNIKKLYFQRKQISRMKPTAVLLKQWLRQTYRLHNGGNPVLFIFACHALTRTVRGDLAPIKAQCLLVMCMPAFDWLARGANASDVLQKNCLIHVPRSTPIYSTLGK